MRSQVQVLAGPPAIPAGHSAVSGEPGAPTASLGRAGAARPSRRHAHRPSRTRPPGAAGPMTTTHRGRHPAQDGSHAAAAATSRWRLLPCPPRSRKRRRSLHRPGLPGRSAGQARPAAVTPPGPGPPPTPLTNATWAASPASGPARPSIEPLQDAAAHRDSTRSCGNGCPPPAPGPHRRRLRWDEMDASGRTEADSSRLDAGRVDTGGAGHRRGWTPDGLDTRRAGHQTGWTPDGWTVGPGRRNR
jgi:hypothetical protein